MNNSILDATPNNLQHFMLMVVRQMQACEDFWCFLLPVLPEDVPDYRDVIKVSTSGSQVGTTRGAYRSVGPLYNKRVCMIVM